MYIEELTSEQIYYLKNGYMEDDITDEEEQQLIQNIINKMKKEFVEYDYIETFLSYDYWDGSNWKEETLKHYFYDTEWEDYTEELEGMKEIDYERYDTGHDTLYKLKDGTHIVVDTSYYQGYGEAIYFINDKDIKTIKEAYAIINKEEEW